MHLRNACLLLIAASAPVFAFCAHSQELSTERFPLPLGESAVDLLVHRSPDSGLTYLNLHDNENTAVEATRSFLRERGGMLFELNHTGERYVTFKLDDSTFTVDPNRIFTDRGIDSTLMRHGHASPRARSAVRSFADALLHRIDYDELAVIVAVHNNSDNAYSVLSYAAEGGVLAGDARLVHIEVDEDPDDFYFVTSEVLFDELRRRGSNVVLQDNRLASDDGSLSVLAGREGVAYVNIEAEHGHFEEQRAMIATLHDVIIEAEGK